MRLELDNLSSMQVINPSFFVHPDDAKYIQENHEPFTYQFIKTSLPNYWAAAMQGISISETAKKQRRPKIRRPAFAS